MLAFRAFLQVSAGAIHWIYLSEVLQDQQFGFVIAVHYFLGMLISVSTEYMIEFMGIDGMFILFGFVTFAGIAGVCCIIKETKGLVDK
jgi:hypothetical protein